MSASSKKRRYEYKITLGKDLNGKLIRRSFYSTKSKTDAKKKAEDFRLKYEMEILTLRPTPTTVHTLNRWKST